MKGAEMRVFIVGATGVIGQALVPRLLERGDTVVVLARSAARAASIAAPGVELIEGDLLTIAPFDLEAALRGCDAAAHMATALRAGSPGLGTTNTNSALRIEGTRKLVDAVLAAGVPRYVQQSIVMSYPDGGDDWLDESTPMDTAAERAEMSRPVIEMEAMVTALDPAQVAWSILRGGSFVGPDTFQDGVVARLREGTQRVPGDGSNWISPIHVEDYAEAVASALHDAPAGSTFNITDEPIRNGDYLDGLAERLGLAPPERDSTVETPRSYRCTNAAARAALAWEPRTSIWPAGE